MLGFRKIGIVSLHITFNIEDFGFINWKRNTHTLSLVGDASNEVDLNIKVLK